MAYAVNGYAKFRGQIVAFNAFSLASNGEYTFDPPALWCVAGTDELEILDQQGMPRRRERVHLDSWGRMWSVNRVEKIAVAIAPSDYVELTAVCPDCSGRGRVMLLTTDEACTRCSGAGRISRESAYRNG